MALLQLFVKNGICPNILRRGNSILLLEIRESNLRFLTSNTYVVGEEFDLIEQFKLPISQIFFPHKFFKKENLCFSGKIPNSSFFTSDFNSKNHNEAILQFVKIREQNNATWTLKKEVVESTVTDVLILTLSMLRFLKESFILQSTLHSSIQNDILENRYLNPFNSPTCSIGSFIYNMFSVFYMNFLDIFVVKNEYGTSHKPVSKVEHEYVSFMEYQYPDKSFLSAFNNQKGQKFFPLKPYDDDPNPRGTYVDLYSPITKQVFFFNGCFFHNHCTNCKIYPNRTLSEVHGSGKTYGQLQNFFENRIVQLLFQHATEIDEVTTIWECQYKELKEKEPILSYLNYNYPKAHPRRRLCPRQAVRGAFFDTYGFKWSKELFPNQKCYFLDVNSLYSFCATSFKYPLGPYKVLIGEDLKQLKIENNKFSIDNSTILGTMLLTICPPLDLLYPFLLYRKIDGTTINTLCKICSEKCLKQCNHSNFERSLTGTYFINEIEYALSLNYTIVAIYEVHYYSKSDAYLRDFCQKLNFLKMKHSHCTENSTNENEMYNEINQKMNFEAPFILSKETIDPNASKRNFYKLCGNAFFGKFLQRTDKETLMFVNDQSQLNDLYYSENEILDVTPINEYVCLVSIKKSSQKRPPNRKFNVYIGGQITANARIFIHEKLMILSKIANLTILKVDCDSLIFACESSLQIPLQISACIGDFKHEINGEIVSYYALGPKQYCITFKVGNKVYSMSKISGVCLTSEINSDCFNEKTFEHFLNQYLNDSFISKKAKQKKHLLKCNDLSIITRKNYFTLTNMLSNRRIIDTTSECLLTTPYGFRMPF